MTTQSADPMIGRLLDGRYQVRSRIARGGMATVYLATDLRLERRVAIKVMHGHLADDNEYRARFIQEARSAARLAHPNVVNVYDQGQDEETAYLVMEYLPGITLRDLLNDHNVLTAVQVFDIMGAVLAGLAAAHQSGIVHRDLKPENILLADDGRIKISDFGLARAAHSHTATGNALLGTIAYLSPELVTRGVADTRSDIYAIGIMLYEMLAGEQPFTGEQAFQVAQQHANDTVPTPSTKNPRVPAELDELVLWATARDPEQRPRDARAMLDQLRETERMLDLGGDESTTSSHQTMVMPALGGGTGETQVIARASPPQKTQVRTDNSTRLAERSDRRRSRGYWLFALVILLVGLAGGTGWYFGAGPGALVAVPSVAGLTVEDATAQLVAADLMVSDTPQQVNDPEIAEGLVVGTDPEKGEIVAHDGVVTLIVSLGPKSLPVPTFAGLTEDAARTLVVESGFTEAETNYQFSKAARGLVIAAFGVDGIDLITVKTYFEQRPIALLVSLGPLPDVTGLSVSDAQNVLLGVKLTGVVSGEEFHDTIPNGDIIRLEPKSDAPVVENDEVNLIVSKGIAQVAVPKVDGMPWAEAKRLLTDAKFVIAYKGDDEFLADNFPGFTTVKSTDPKGGTEVDKGSTITVDLKGAFD